MIQKFLNWKTIGVIVIVVLLLSLLNKCNDTDSLRGELKQIKLQKEMAEKLMELIDQEILYSL